MGMPSNVPGPVRVNVIDAELLNLRRGITVSAVAAQEGIKIREPRVWHEQDRLGGRVCAEP
jgi:hypothetical protein